MLDPRLVATDAYDREAFAAALGGVPDAADLLQRGERLLPFFAALVEDLFASLFKLVVTVRPEDRSPAATALNRRLLTALTGAPGFLELKEETALSAPRAAHAACRLARRALAMVRSGELLLEEELSAAKELAGEEERGEALEAAARDLAKDAPDEAERMRAAAAQARQRARALARSVAQSVTELPPAMDSQLAQAADALAEELPQLEDQTQALAHAVGASVPRATDERLRLAEALQKSEKLRALAALAGAFRAEARAVRRRRRERAPAEVYRVGRGAALSQLLPSELLGLRHPVRRRDFLRRFVEGELAQYELRGDDRHGRGPIVVCLDGSGSMAGARELWAKAVALALLDVARRQGRRARAFVFSGPEAPLERFELTAGARFGRPGVALSAVAGLAECFPGGGTDFEKPLRAALDSVREQGLRGADVVFVTDGEARLSEAFVQEFGREKRRRDLALHAVLVEDPGQPGLGKATGEGRRELEKVADRITTVAELSPKAARGLFRGV